MKHVILAALLVGIMVQGANAQPMRILWSSILEEGRYAGCRFDIYNTGSYCVSCGGSEGPSESDGGQQFCCGNGQACWGQGDPRY